MFNVTAQWAERVEYSAVPVHTVWAPQGGSRAYSPVTSRYCSLKDSNAWANQPSLRYRLTLSRKPPLQDTSAPKRWVVDLILHSIRMSRNCLCSRCRSDI